MATPAKKTFPHADERIQSAMRQAHAQLDAIREAMQAYQTANEAEDDHAREQAEEAINELPLSCEVRSGWASCGADFEPEEYRILLCTGGPAVQIVGTLDGFSQPADARLQCQDWFTPWTEVQGLTSDDDALLLDFAQRFQFGE